MNVTVAGQCRQRTTWAWMMPAAGGAWLLFSLGTSAYLLRREFHADTVRQLWCRASCTGLVHPPGSIPGVLLGVAAVALFAALVFVPHRGRLRVARTVMLAALIAASWGAEALLFAPFFFWS